MLSRWGRMHQEGAGLATVSVLQRSGDWEKRLCEKLQAGKSLLGSGNFPIKLYEIAYGVNDEGAYLGAFSETSSPLGRRTKASEN